MSNRLSDKLIRVKLDEINRNLFNLMDSESMNIILKSIAEYAEEYAKFRLDEFISDHFPELDKDLENAIKPPDTGDSTSTSYKVGFNRAAVESSEVVDSPKYVFGVKMDTGNAVKYTSSSPYVRVESLCDTPSVAWMVTTSGGGSHLKKEAISELIKEALDNEDQTTFDELVEVYKGL